jgi:predicted enzyme related to lactoylglutathione lyase
VARVRELGGESGDPQEIPNVGRYATCTDTEGNAFGLFQTGR